MVVQCLPPEGHHETCAKAIRWRKIRLSAGSIPARTMTEVRDDAARQRYVLQASDAYAFIDYRRSGGIVTMTHAEVPPALRGRGLGAALVAGALERVRERGEKVVPLCPFIEHYMRRHPAVHDLLAGSGESGRRL